MKAKDSFLCQECREVFEKAPCGSCPVCLSTSVFPLTFLILSPQERQAWLDRINGRGEEEYKEGEMKTIVEVER